MKRNAAISVVLMVFSAGLIAACADATNPVESREKRTSCTEEYAPVCDADGNIYGNTCKAVAAGARVSPSCHVAHLETPIETEHPYANNDRRSYPVEAPAGAEKLRVEFNGFDTERNYDSVRVFGGSDEIAQYWGNLGTFMSAEIPGNRANIVLNTDGSVTRHGFAVYRYVYFTPCACRMMYSPVCGVNGVTYDNTCEAQCEGQDVAFHIGCEEALMGLPRTVESAHPYANNFDRTWIVQEGASFIRGHFTTIETETGYDFVEILDGSDKVVARYSGRHDDVVTPLIPGGMFKIRLVSDYSVNKPGFVLDRIDVAGGCYDGRDCPQGQGCHQVQCVRAPCFKMCVDCPMYMMPPPWWCDGGVVVAKEGPDGCSLPPGCSRQEGALCGGEHEFQCDEGFSCVNGTCRAAATECFIGGCSSQVCTDRADVITTCEFMPWYQCYRDATCEAQSEGQCGWTPTPALEQCLRDMGAPGYEAGTNEPCGGIGNTQCKPGLECVGQDPAIANSAGICRKICGPSIPSGHCEQGYFCDVTSNAGTPDVCERRGRTGLCMPSPVECTWVEAPVCGCDGVTYSNDCHRQLAAAELDHEGACAGDDTCNVPSDCTAPVMIECVGEYSCIEGQCDFQCDQHRYASQDTPLNIPDAGSVRSVITAGTVGVIESLVVSVDILHSWRGDLILELSHGTAGTVYVLFARQGGSADDLQLVDVPVTAFNGQLGDGEWTLTVTDAATWDTGLIKGWSLDIN